MWVTNFICAFSLQCLRFFQLVLHHAVVVVKLTSRSHRPTTMCSQVYRSSEVLTSVDSVVTEFLLNTEDLVELGQALRPSWCSSLDLSRTEANNNVSNGDVLGLTRAVRYHDAPSSTKCVLGSLDSLGDGADLVDLEEESVAGLELNSLLDKLGVGDGQVVTTSPLAMGPVLLGPQYIPNNLEVGGLEEVGPCLPVILSEGVFDADNGVLLSQLLVELGELLVAEPLALVAIGVLEVHIILLLLGLVELAGSNVHCDLDLASVASLLDGVGDEVERLLGSLNVGSNTTLVADISCRLSVSLLRKALELLVDLGTLAHGLGESGSLPAHC
jgi:hypothetical protein